MHRPYRAALAALLLAAPAAAHAHATLETQQATVPSTYKAVLRVPHGCKASPTLRVRVQIPEGVIAVKPMPKPGWQLETVKAAYARTYDYYGTPMSEGVREIVWSGRLLDEHYDEFVFRAYLTEALKAVPVLYFPVVQECAEGVHRWIEIPEAGKSADDYKEPAPAVKLSPKP
jgi:uncharacterized protein YcnI